LTRSNQLLSLHLEGRTIRYIDDCRLSLNRRNVRQLQFTNLRQRDKGLIEPDGKDNRVMPSIKRFKHDPECDYGIKRASDLQVFSA
jgi:hypothetical protein